MNEAGTTRRGFLTATALTSVATAAAKTLKPSVLVRSSARVVGANDRINIGSIGVGGMGSGQLRSFVAQSEKDKDIQVVAVSDIYKKRKDRARDLAHLTDKDVHHDYRDLLLRSDVDAVIIATPDHWHAQMAIDAMAAGKDVYLQKPMTLTIEESKDVVDAASKYKRVLQVGSQYLSDPHYHKAKELIAAGEIGELLWAQVTYSRNSGDGEWNYRVEPEGTPETIDWPQWLGTAPKRPFSAERYFRWRKYWDYSGGIATDLFYHMLGPMLYAMGPQFPVRVMGSGGIFVQKDREVPDTYVTLIEYPEFFINISASMANAAANKFFPRVIYGHKGTLAFERDSVVIYPENLTRSKEQPAPKTYPIPPFSMDRAHSDDFFSCIRSRKRTVLNPELGYQIMTAIKLGVDSYRAGQIKNFDPRTRRLVGKAARRPAYEGDGINHQTT